MMVIIRFFFLWLSNSTHRRAEDVWDEDSAYLEMLANEVSGFFYLLRTLTLTPHRARV